MTEGELLSLMGRALWLTLALSLPPIIAAAVVGTFISLVQALTQMQDQTLSFAFKLVAVVAVVALTARTIGAELYEYTLFVFDQFVSIR
jgi:type III secretion protein S